MYTAGSLELYRGVEIQLCKLHTNIGINTNYVRSSYRVLIRHWHFYRNLPVAGNSNATFAAVDHWDAHLGLRLTRKALYKLHSHPALNKEGLHQSISFSAIFTALSLKCGSLASLNFEKILSQNLTYLSRIIFINLPIFRYFEMVLEIHSRQR